MRKALLFLAVFGLFGSLWAVEPLGVGTWKLNIAKSKLPASAAKLKETIVVFRLLDADTMEGTSTDTLVDGTTNLSKWTVPIVGGTLTYQQGPYKDVEGLLIISTSIDPYTMHNTYVYKGKQAGLMFNKISKDAKSFTVTSPGIDEQKKPVEYIYLFEKQ